MRVDPGANDYLKRLGIDVESIGGQEFDDDDDNEVTPMEDSYLFKSIASPSYRENVEIREIGPKSTWH